MARKSERKNRSARKRFQLQEQLEQRKKQKEEEVYKDIKKTAIGLSIACACVIVGFVLFAILAA